MIKNRADLFAARLGTVFFLSYAWSPTVFSQNRCCKTPENMLWPALRIQPRGFQNQFFSQLPLQEKTTWVNVGCKPVHLVTEHRPGVANW